MPLPATNPSPLPQPPIASAQQLAGRDLLTLTGLTPGAIGELFQTARRMKSDIAPYRRTLDGRTVILLFEKASLRTRITFETGVNKLGGTALYMDHSAQRLGEREAVKDYGKNLDRWVDCIVARVYSQRIIEELTDASRVPVINALSDRFHPCQGLADLFTLWERPGGLRPGGRRLRLAYVGDGNNVCHSLMHAATMLGVDTTVVTPPGFEPAPDVTAECQAYAAAAGSTLRLTDDPEGVAGHDAVYTDVWVSMGQADAGGKRRKAFADYQIDADLMAVAGRGTPSGAVFMHCLPAQRGVEVTDEVIDSAASVVYDQAENRMHVQNALLSHMLGAPPASR